MLFMVLKSVIHSITEKGGPCPKCYGTNTDCRNGIWHCYDCGKEW